MLAEQNLQFVMALANRVYILEKGEVRFTGTPADLKADERIIDSVCDGVTNERPPPSAAAAHARRDSERNVDVDARA